MLAGAGNLGKAELRAHFLKLRQSLGAQGTSATESAQRNLLNCDHYRKAGTVMVYLPFRGEAGTSLIIEDALRRGTVVAAPVTLKDLRRLVPMRLTGRAGELRQGVYGILEPDPARCSPVSPESIDLVVVPGVAFDLSGGRLGYGGGYYDQFLTLEAGQAIRAGLGFEIQLSPHVLPLDAHDVRMDLTVTEGRVLRHQRQELGS